MHLFDSFLLQMNHNKIPFSDPNIVGALKILSLMADF